MRVLYQQVCEGLFLAFAGVLQATHPASPPLKLAEPVPFVAPLAPRPTPAPAVKTKKMVAHARGTAYAKQGFLEHLPRAYASGRSPLLIAYHGRGENGVGNEKSLETLYRNGVPGLIENNHWPEEKRPFVVLAPQHEGIACPTGKEISEFISFAKSHYKIDEQRVYLTGLSCGARGIADYLRNYGPKGIAATVLVAGDLAPAVLKQKCELPRKLPMWIFHGIDDQVVRIGDDDAAVDFMMNDCNERREVKYTRYPETGHDAWTRAYAGNHHDVFDWLLNWKSEAVHSASASALGREKGSTP